MVVQEILHQLEKVGGELAFVESHLRIRAPRGAVSLQLKTEIYKFRNELAQYLRGAKAKPALSIPRNRADLLPLSYAQERLWFLDRLGLTGPAYSNPTAVSLQGAVDVILLERSFSIIVERHETLRTRFAVVNGRPVQLIDAATALPLEVLELSAVAREERSAVTHEVLQARLSRTFDLERGPLVRISLLVFSREEHVLLANMHHIISDGWSKSVLIREIATIYAALRGNRLPLLPELPFQYVDYANWQREQLQGANLDRLVAYWTQRLFGAPAMLELPTDHARPAVPSYSGGYVGVSLPSDVVSKLNALARSEGATLFMVLLAAFQLMLKRHSGQDNIVVGSPIAGRTHRGLEGLIGFFVNMVALRTDLSGDSSFRELIASVRDTALEAYAHQELPFEKLVEELNPVRDLGRQPIFQVLFALQNMPQDRFDLPDLKLERIEGSTGTSKFDLSLYVQERGDKLEGLFEYASDLFYRSTIERLAAHYQSLLQQIVAGPDRNCSQLARSIPSLGIDVVVSSTFTGDALVDPLRIWCERLRLTAKVSTTGYNQVLQSLLSDQPTSRDANHFHVILLRLKDWGRRTQTEEQRDDGNVVANFGDIERNVEDFIERLRILSASDRGHLLIAICPDSTEALASDRNALRLRLIESRLTEAIRDFPRLSILPLANTISTLGVSEVHDSYLDRIADIPYTPAFFFAAATAVVRAVFATIRHPYKVIVADCDNTLWRGTCGEDGPLRVAVTPGCRLLQEFLVRQAHNGVLVCLCSRNNESDVKEVFQSNRNMLLSWEDVVAHRIGWGPKSTAISELADELDLSLDCFVFLDDDGVECAKMQNDRPEVLTLRVPQDDREVGDFLQRLWLFDGVKPTAEDRKRSQRYRLESLRREVRQKSPSLQGFIAGLELKIDLRSAIEEDLDRVVQITERTTQFNTTGLRLTDADVRRLIGSIDKRCMIIEVSDRFGDYGKSGLLVIDACAPLWVVTCFALSCRVLGREVEYRILELLNEQARAAGVTGVAFEFRQSVRNVPAQRFLQELRSLAAGQEEVPSFTFSLDQIESALRCRRQTADMPPAITPNDDEPAASPVIDMMVDLRAARQRFYRLVLEYRSALDIEREFGVTAPGKRSTSGLYVPPRNPTEEVLAGIWCKILKLDRVGVNDNFFELGGHSLLATRLMARIRDSRGVELPLRALFEAPTVAELSERLEAVQREGGGLAVPALIAGERPSHLPLSYAQERLWLLEQLGLVGSAYHIPVAVRLQGALDIAALRRAFTEVVRRHEGMRTRFEIKDGVPCQVIDRSDGFVFDLVDLSAIADARGREDETRRLSVMEASRAFDLRRGPLLRAKLLRLGAQEHVVVVVIHHIVSDGWSIGILIREIGVLYEAYSQSRPSPLPEFGIQYADYALWQRSWLQGEVLERQVSYWKERLSEAPEALELPTDHARPAVPSYRGGVVEFVLSADLTRGLNGLARSEGVTLFMVLLAGFLLLLKRYSGYDDIVVGSPIAGRTHRELEGLIGFFVNTLALRTDLSGGPSFRQLIGRVRETALGAFAHQDLSFERLVAELQPVRDLSRQPIFQVLFALQNLPQETLDLPGLRLSRMGGDHVTSKLDLSLYMQEQGKRLVGFLEYATDLFERATIERLAGHLRVVLEGIVANPDAAIDDLPLLCEAERHRVVEEWNDTAAAYPRDKCLHELFAEQSERTPHAVAIVFEDQQLSYAELDRRSNQLAHYLRSVGVSAETIVGLCVERSLEMVIGLLGILKAGGAYLPLDPGYPAGRLAYMLSDAGVRLVLTAGAAAASPLAGRDARLLRLDAEAEAVARNPTTAPRGIDVTPQNLAYVLYTSGSTGKPKGVMGTHGAVVARLHWDATDPSGDEVYVQKTTPNFIDMLWEVFMPLIRGQRLVIAGADVSKDPRVLIELLGQHRVSRIVLVPSLMRAMLEVWEDLADRLPDLRYWSCSGEALDQGLVKLFRSRLPAARLLNIYGTSEFWDASWYVADHDVGRQGAPIGRPITNMRLYVLDRDLHPVPIGVSGELFIGGVGLARGYLHRPDLTAERFMPSPFGHGERLYRTGDLVRYLSDGNLEFLGREDRQVKLRGYRIELGEIEAALQGHAEVRQAVAMVREDVPGSKRLVAYVVFNRESPDVISLRTELKSRLPDNMIPAAFIVLDTLPLTPNGKIDRKALPLPAGDTALRATYVEPQTPTEEVLAEIWREILKLEAVGVDDNFFDLGGHSLLLLQVHRQILKRLSREVPITWLFQHPTIRALSMHLTGKTAARSQIVSSEDRGKKRRQSAVKRRHASSRNNRSN